MTNRKPLLQGPEFDRKLRRCVIALTAFTMSLSTVGTWQAISTDAPQWVIFYIAESGVIAFIATGFILWFCRK